MPSTYNLFISHSWGYSDAYNGMVSLLEDYSYFTFNNYSVPKDDPVHTAGTDRELEQASLQKMNGCHVVIIVAGVYATYSKWIKKEIKMAKEGFQSPKPILAVKPWANKQTSQTVADAADKIVGWNSSSIVTAIRELS